MCFSLPTLVRIRFFEMLSLSDSYFCNTTKRNSTPLNVVMGIFPYYLLKYSLSKEKKKYFVLRMTLCMLTSLRTNHQFDLIISFVRECRRYLPSFQVKMRLRGLGRIRQMSQKNNKYFWRRKKYLRWSREVLNILNMLFLFRDLSNFMENFFLCWNKYFWSFFHFSPANKSKMFCFIHSQRLK